MITLGEGHPSDFKSLVFLIIEIIELVVFFIMAITVIVILWGMFTGWIMHGGDTKGVEQGKKVLFAGIIGLVVMTSLWGIVSILKITFFG